MKTVKPNSNIIFHKAWLLMVSGLLFISCNNHKSNYQSQAKDILKDSVLMLADENVNALPVTVTSAHSPRSAGGLHDFYSEGDYWWPNPDDPGGPYIRRDGQTNPDNFTAHREAMVRFSRICGNLTSAYILTKDTTYSEATKRHIRAWFVNDSTLMNPNLLYAQAIKGRHTGRGIGIIDAIHLMEVVQSIQVLDSNQQIDAAELDAIKKWFNDFVTWLTTHTYGKDEMVHPNNHSTCWNMQVGLYARFTNNDTILDFCRDNYKHTLLPNQMAKNGSFPLELERTKPYGYSLFNLDAMVMNCVVLSDEEHDLWSYATPEGKNISLALEFMHPYVADKSSWPYEPDVMYWENWPVAHPSFLFGAIHYDQPDYFKVWAEKKHFLEIREVIRNMPIRNPIIWFDHLSTNSTQ